MTDNPLAWDDGSSIYCGLCPWSRPVKTMEQMEFYARQHLEEAHGRKLVFRVNESTGKVTKIP